MNKDKQALIIALDSVNKDIETYNKTLIKMLETIKCDSIDWYSVNNKVQYLKDRKNLILFELASKY